jgi:hypothetical protein
LKYKEAIGFFIGIVTNIFDTISTRSIEMLGSISQASRVHNAEVNLEIEPPAREYSLTNGANHHGWLEFSPSDRDNEK